MSAAEPPPIPGPVPPPPLPPAPRRPLRRSVLSFLGAVAVTVSLFILIQTLANLLPTFFMGRPAFQDPGAVVAFIAAPAAVTLTLALLGTIFGWVGLAGIRQASGQRRGITFGLVAALTWPMLVFNALVLFLPAVLITQAMAMHGNFPGPGFILGALLLAVICDLLLAMSIARWAAVRSKAAALEGIAGQRLVRHKPILSGVFAVAYLAAAIFLGIFAIKERAERAQMAQAQQWNNMQPPPPQGAPMPGNAPEPFRGNRQAGLRPIPIPDAPPLQPGETLEANVTLFPEADLVSELRLTFWSNGVPVDLPAMGVKAKLTADQNSGLPAEWQLKLEADGTHFTLTGPAFNGADAPGSHESTRLEIPADVQMMALPGDDMVRPKATGPARRWLFLSLNDARAGRRLNAEWAVSIDFYSRNLAGLTPLRSVQPATVVPLQTLQVPRAADQQTEPK